MDRTEAAAACSRPQSRVSPILFWALVAAVLLRIVTAVMERRGDETEGVGLVEWQPRENAATISLSSGKPVLYDFTAEWCGPCKLLDKDWADSDIAGRVNASYVPTRVMDRQREDGRNSPEVAELERRYEISGFPTLVVAAADGTLIGKMEGYRGREALESFLEKPEAK